MWMFIVIFFFHGIFLLSVFDIYFRSSVHSGIDIIENHIKTDTKRLVLFVCDGLPANYLYEFSNNNTNAPFIRSIVEKDGVWGLSYTRVPTESRPGHVALIAGLYEDPSAVFKGWKENPVTFDSVFNQTEATYMWGCQDILHLFEKGTHGQIHSYSYPSEMQDYSGKRGAAASLDDWVLHNFKDFIAKSILNKTISDLKDRSKVVFFFHLLGIDVAGHASKPHTVEYWNTIRNADKVVREITSIIDQVFNDSSTSYIVTSDHGMTDWGSHGAGSLIETLTPIVAWGAGIKKQAVSGQMLNSFENIKAINSNRRKDAAIPLGSFEKWNLDHIKRFDMDQADVAVLMATLLGVSIPVNSLGILPKDILDMSNDKMTHVYFLNAQQLLKQFEAKEHEVRSHLASFLFSHYKQLTSELKVKKIESINNAILSSDFDKAVSGIDSLISIILDGIEYYDNYFKNILLFHVLFGFFAICIAIIGEVIKLWDPDEFNKYIALKAQSTAERFVLFFTSTSLAVVVISCIANVIPVHYFLYAVTTIFLTSWAILKNPWVFTLPFLLLSINTVLTASLYLSGIVFLVISFYHRWVLSIALVVFSLWPFANSILRKNASYIQNAGWMCSCLLLSGFPLLPIVGIPENIFLKITVGFSWFLILRLLLNFQPFKFLGIRNIVSRVQLFLSLIGICNMYDINRRYRNGEGIELYNQILSFSVLFIFLGSMKFGSNRTYSRFLNLSYSLGFCFLLFSTSYEAFFPLILTFNLFNWLLFEEKIHKTLMASVSYYRKRQQGFISSGDFRRSFFFIFYVFVSFFGIGNLASINSFDTNWVRGFITTFSPFIMMQLILLRTILPMFLVTCTFRFVIHYTHANSRVLFLIVIFFCDVMAVQLLYNVTNKGSWLEIGTSLSHFIIIESIVLFLLLLYYIASYVTTSVIEPFVKKEVFLPR